LSVLAFGGGAAVAAGGPWRMVRGGVRVEVHNGERGAAVRNLDGERGGEVGVQEEALSVGGDECEEGGGMSKDVTRCIRVAAH